MDQYSPADKGEIRADIIAMYRAGTQELPDKAEELGEVAELMVDAMSGVGTQLATFGSPRIGSDLLSLLSDCHAGVRRAVVTLNNIGAAVIAIADDFKERDDFARSVFNGLDADLKAGPDPKPVPPAAPTPGYDASETPSGPYLPGEVG